MIPVFNYYPPPDKSISHRAIFMAAMAVGRSRVYNLLKSEDTLATLNAVKAFGCKVEDHEDGVTIDSPGRHQWQSSLGTIDCANSGTTARLLLGILAGLPQIQATLVGDESLSQRPMKRVMEPLLKMGAKIECHQDNFLPARIFGQALKGCHLQLNIASAQLKSALLLAALNAEGETFLSMPSGSRSHTEEIFRYFGVIASESGVIASESAVIASAAKQSVSNLSLQGPIAPFKGQNMFVPNDPSSAIFLTLFMLLTKRSSLKINAICSDPARTYAYKKLEAAGVNILWQNIEERQFSVEKTCDLLIHRCSNLKAFEILEEEVPALIDEIPALALVAAFAEGVSRFYSLQELKVKESDRLLQTLNLLKKIGVRAGIEKNNLWIEGQPNIMHQKMDYFSFDPLGDHRLAMSSEIIGRVLAKKYVINGIESVKVSYPHFLKDLKDFQNYA